MAIFRVNKDKDNPYVQINKRSIQNNQLSWKAKGLLAHILSLPDSWELRRKHLMTCATDGRDSLDSGLKELEQAGHLKRYQKRNEDGSFGEWIIEVFETPIQQFEPLTGIPEAGTPFLINNNSINNDTPLCVPPQGVPHQLQKKERKDEEGRTEVIENQPEDQFNKISITEDERRSGESENQDSNLVRFSENAKLTNEFHNAALSAGIHSTWIKDVFAKFREFWSKKQTVKSEGGWHQTWQSWCEKEFDSKRIPKRLCNESKPFLEDTEHLQAQEPIVNTDDKDERISEVKKRVLKRIGPFEYRNWIENLRFEIEGNSLKVYANTQFVADWVKRVYATTIKACSTFDSVEVIFALEPQVQQQQQQLQAGQAYYAIDADPRIRDMRQKICDRLGAAFYRSNIERAKIEVTGNFMKIYVKNKHCVSYIERRLSSIYAALETEIGHIEVGIDSDRIRWKGVA